MSKSSGTAILIAFAVGACSGDGESRAGAPDGAVQNRPAVVADDSAASRQGTRGTHADTASGRTHSTEQHPSGSSSAAAQNEHGVHTAPNSATRMAHGNIATSPHHARSSPAAHAQHETASRAGEPGSADAHAADVHAGQHTTVANPASNQAHASSAAHTAGMGHNARGNDANAHSAVAHTAGAPGAQTPAVHSPSAHAPAANTPAVPVGAAHVHSGVPPSSSLVPDDVAMEKLRTLVAELVRDPQVLEQIQADSVLRTMWETPSVRQLLLKRP